MVIHLGAYHGIRSSMRCSGEGNVVQKCYWWIARRQVFWWSRPCSDGCQPQCREGQMRCACNISPCERKEPALFVKTPKGLTGRARFQNSWTASDRICHNVNFYRRGRSLCSGLKEHAKNPLSGARRSSQYTITHEQPPKKIRSREMRPPTAKRALAKINNFVCYAFVLVFILLSFVSYNML